MIMGTAATPTMGTADTNNRVAHTTPMLLRRMLRGLTSEGWTTAPKAQTSPKGSSPAHDDPMVLENPPKVLIDPLHGCQDARASRRLWYPAPVLERALKL